jgi:hypothetical protein
MCIDLMPYSMNNWWEKKALHKYDEMFFLFLGSELIEKFYKSKIKFNLLLELPP